ncbi:MAG: ABC transporter ATP-binding protein [Lachnospiraceae bacterium]|nr:ABC transporter ATP-binding protein [Lachnospiraceae bacterium]
MYENIQENIRKNPGGRPEKNTGENRREGSDLLLAVRNLSVAFPGGKREATVVDTISFSLRTGEVLGIVGESGSGKSMTALALMGLLKKGAVRSADAILFDGKDLNRVSAEEYRDIRGRSMAMIFQEPMTSLNPVYTVGNQVEEMLKLHAHLSKEERKQKTIQAFEEAGIRDSAEVWGKYPHQLSGGQRQRVMIAMAMICEPKLLIADEPTTALDVTIQARILALIKKLNREHGTAVILISHDLGVIRNICDRTLVMYQGKIVERGSIEEIFSNPKENYTRTLLDAVPGIHKRDDAKAAGAYGTAAAEYRDILVSVRDLTVAYKGNKEGLFGRRRVTEAVSHIDFDIYKGEILGLVGESGCGKSTTAKAIAGLIDSYTGTITPDNRKPQMVFQDPYGSLNPCKTIGWILEEPLKMQGMKRAVDRVAKAKELLAEVGLPVEYAARYPRDLSGGQRQRVAIAAALITGPQLLILDEPVSALDVTVQAQILDLLQRIRRQHNLTYLFISHDMNVIYQICDRVCVMTQGTIVETAAPRELIANPKHEYTRQLLASVPE